MNRRGFLMLGSGAFFGRSWAISNTHQWETVDVAGDRLLSLVMHHGSTPHIASLDLGSADTNVLMRPLDRLDAGSAERLKDGFGDVVLIAQEHQLWDSTRVLAVADAQGRWRVQPLRESPRRALPVKDMLLVRHLVSRGGRHFLGGISLAGRAHVVVLHAITGQFAGHWQADASEGEVSQLIALPGHGMLAVANDRQQGSALLALNDRAQVLRHLPLPGGAASVAIAASGEMLVAYRQERQWSLMLLDGSWKPQWNQALVEAVGPATRTLKLLWTGSGWWVAGGFEGKVFVQQVSASGEMGPRWTDDSGLLPPSDHNWHAVMQNRQVWLRGVTRQKKDLQTGGMTEFLWRPQ